IPLRSILPFAFFGSSSLTMISFGIMYGGPLFMAYSLTESIAPSSPPFFKEITAITSWPTAGFSTPKAQASCTSPEPRRRFSTSSGLRREPWFLIMASSRPAYHVVAHGRVLDPEGASLVHEPGTEEEVLDLLGAQAVALVLDHGVLAPEKVQIPLLVPRDGVPRIHDPLHVQELRRGERVRAVRLSRRLLVAPVA